MIYSCEIVLTPDKAGEKEELYIQAARKLKLGREEITAVVPERRSIDGRSRDPVFRMQVSVYTNELPSGNTYIFNFRPADASKRVAIIGSGPAGLFAAIKLIEHGITPVIFERGKNVRDRRKDLRAIQQFNTVNPDSNYCFGEGGAGTYSDGKLYTRSTKRGDIKRTLSLLVHHGAHPDILIDSHPHIGSNKLPKVVEALRNTIQNCGGEIHFDSRVTDIYTDKNRITGLQINGSKDFTFNQIILATGHSARDVFRMLERRSIAMESKPFAVGVRIEHPQELINRKQYHNSKFIPLLPAASYSITCQVGGKGAFSFCMCPGGIIVPAATSPGEIVVNGMSMSRRDSKFANSGFVVTVDHQDFERHGFGGVFAGIDYQQMIEQKAFSATGSQQAPAQRVTDFLADQVSSSLPSASYIPGFMSVPLAELFPASLTSDLKVALKMANQKLRGFTSEEAVICAPESRTSSPVTVLRNRETLESTSHQGLFPAGEGCGYAGGIISAAIDGERCAASLIQKYFL
ncbi:MAG: FAD-dependent oxidoreductase [Ignavibacteriaceae bacterium]|nr:FAD-dependent oxidoreductase [Ignavibacteriaceae bacterium]